MNPNSGGSGYPQPVPFDTNGGSSCSVGGGGNGGGGNGGGGGGNGGGGSCGPLGSGACAPGTMGGLPSPGPSVGYCPGSTTIGVMTCAVPV